MSARIPVPPASMIEPPAPVPAAYLGVWQRSLLQTPRWHADLRIPAGRPDFAGVTSLAECDDAQLAWLATQQGFCGVTQVVGERCTWHRQMDIQPADGSRDTGRMIIDGERMTETGIEADYLEIWDRLPHSRGGVAALELAAESGRPPDRPTWLLVAGDCFMFVRGRTARLPRAADLTTLIAHARPDREQLLGGLRVATKQLSGAVGQ